MPTQRELRDPRFNLKLRVFVEGVKKM